MEFRDRIIMYLTNDLSKTEGFALATQGKCSGPSSLKEYTYTHRQNDMGKKIIIKPKKKKVKRATNEKTNPTTSE